MPLGFLVARAAGALAVSSLLLSYLVDASGIDMLVEREAEAGGGSAPSLPSWYVKSSPWLAGLIAVAAAGHAAWPMLCEISWGQQLGCFGRTTRS